MLTEIFKCIQMYYVVKRKMNKLELELEFSNFTNMA